MRSSKVTPTTAWGARWLLVLLWCWSWPAFSHQPGMSSLDVRIETAQMVAKFTFAVQDIEAFTPMDSDLDAEVSDAEREAAKPLIAQWVFEHWNLVVDEQSLRPVEPGVVHYDEQNNAHVEFHFRTVPHHMLEVQSPLLASLQEGHQQYLSIKDVSGHVWMEKVLNRADARAGLSFDQGVAQTASHTAFVDFLKLGVEHIVTGYDHLLFLLALLVVTHSVWPAISIITFFTIAHSITLALSGLNVIDLPSSFVEPFIAATIVYVAVENLIRGDHPKGRHWLTFAFGLIHGFGFASVLRELDIGSGDSGILLPLLSFNLGIELGQISVAIVMLPIIWQLNNRLLIADKFLKACSILVALMGIYWFLERTVF